MGVNKHDADTLLIGAIFLLAPLFALFVGLWLRSVVHSTAYSISIGFASGVLIYMFGCWMQVQARGPRKEDRQKEKKDL